MKRKQCTRSQHPELSPPLQPVSRPRIDTSSESYICATDVKNYIINDPLVDWLKLYTTTEQTNTFFNFITKQSHEFEAGIIEYFKLNKLQVVTISNSITTQSCRETIRHMKIGTHIIHSAPFQNSKKQIKGIIDLLVRSDCLHLIVKQNPLPVNLQTHKAPNLSGNYHYVVIDIKFSTLPLRIDGIHLLNSGKYPAYKSQLLIYTNGISDIQAYTSRYAFILGRRCSSSSTNCLDKLGVIDYEDVDKEYIQRTVDAMKWIRDLRQHGEKWTLYPPTRQELYPNMCIDSGIWNSEKQKISDQLSDITQIWNCGVKHRAKAFLNDIKSWRDPRFCSQIIGITGARADIIDKIININRQDTFKILPRKITSRLYNWNSNANQIYIDFETLCDVFSPMDEIPQQIRTEKIFMIGVWYKEPTYSDYYYDRSHMWSYKNFTATSLHPKEEYRIMNEFIQFIRLSENPKMWYWHADKSIWERAENRLLNYASESVDTEMSNNILHNWKLENWADLCKLFRDEPIVIRGVFKFGLKEIANAMYNHRLICTKIPDGLNSGLEASILAWKVYKSSEDPINDPVIKDIENYNKFDVSVLADILSYLKLYHI
jgi:hypothetical protein